jgi:hypothetical protein
LRLWDFEKKKIEEAMELPEFSRQKPEEDVARIVKQYNIPMTPIQLMISLTWKERLIGVVLLIAVFGLTYARYHYDTGRLDIIPKKDRDRMKENALSISLLFCALALVIVEMVHRIGAQFGKFSDYVIKESREKFEEEKAAFNHMLLDYDKTNNVTLEFEKSEDSPLYLIKRFLSDTLISEPSYFPVRVDDMHIFIGSKKKE